MAELDVEGYAFARGVVPAVALEALLGEFDDALPGERRFRADGALGDIVERGSLRRLATDRLGAGARPVRLILFDKSEETNWALGWHQDRVIAVRERVDVDGYENWSRKWGAQHVQPPFDIVERLLTVRLHCDDCTVENGALEVLPGSHRAGRLDDAATLAAVEQGDPVALECPAGDAIVLATSILHRSPASRGLARRRVIHVDYAAFDLPAPLAWAYECAQ